MGGVPSKRVYLVVVESVSRLPGLTDTYLVNGRFRTRVAPDVGDLIELRARRRHFEISPPREYTTNIDLYIPDRNGYLTILSPTPYVNVDFAFLEHDFLPGTTATYTFVDIRTAHSREKLFQADI